MKGAALALDVLQAKDLFGLLAIDTRVQEVVPLARISDKVGASKRIAGIYSGGGGIYVYTSLAEALPVARSSGKNQACHPLLGCGRCGGKVFR